MKNIFRLYTLLIFVTFTYSGLKAQTNYGNEWIDPAKTYLKLKVAKNGIYKVTYEELITAGFDATNKKGADLKLINFGKETAIYVSDNDFGPGDYFEFYGEKNTIGLDSLLFTNWRQDLFNPEYSLVTDTNAYFLTLSPESNNQRYFVQTPDFNTNTLSPFPFYLHEEKIIFKDVFFKNIDGAVRYSNFEASEGFGSGLSATSTTEIITSEYESSGPLPILTFRTGSNNNQSKIDISFNGILKDSYTSGPTKTNQFFYSLNKSEIKNTNILNIKNTYSTLDFHRLSYVSLIYPRKFEFSGQSVAEIKMPVSASTRYLEFSSFKTGNKPVYLYDIQKKIRYATAVVNGKVKAIINGSASETKYILVSEDGGVQKVNGISIFKPKSLDNKGQQFIIISNKALRGNDVDYVQEYADYRSSEAGGDFQTEIIDIQDIYDNFGYGIDRHFISIKNLAGYMHKKWTKTAFVLILGKAIEYPYLRSTEDILTNDKKVFFVPTFGYSGSDNMLFSEANFPDPYFAIGRIAVTTPDDIKNYLDKIKAYDEAPRAAQTIEDKYWMKRVLHLSGGGTVTEQSSIKSSLLNMENIIEQSTMGAEVNTYYKTSTDVLQSATSSQIKNLINTGLNIITFFGHSAVGTFDFSLEDPKDYKNTGKYPLINSLGCYSGNIHTLQSGISESFVLEKEKGAIAFLASSGTAFINDLSNFGAEFYDNLGNVGYGKTIGETNMLIAKKYRNLSFSNLAFYQQMTYHGDPAIKLYTSEGPDYIFDFNTIKTSPKLISSNTKDAILNFDIVNLGKASSDSLEVKFVHQLPSGAIYDTIFIKIDAPFVRKSYTVRLANAGIDGIGKNTIFASIDPLNKIVELPASAGETNNDLSDNTQNGFSYFVLDNTAFPIYPDEYSIVNNKNLVLQASTNNAFLSTSTYLFEIDTTVLFNSPFKKRENIASGGGLISWKPDLNYTPNTVYYWRVTPDSINPEIGFIWQKSSFIYMPESQEGWNHSHYFQFTDDNKYRAININEKRLFTFPLKDRTIELINAIYIPGEIGYKVDLSNPAASIRPWTFNEGGCITIAVIDPTTGGHLGKAGGHGGQYGSINTTARGSDFCYAFKTQTSEDRKKIIDFLKNEIQDGYYVTFFSVLNSAVDNIKGEDWASDAGIFGESIISVLEKEGAQKINQLTTLGTVPYTFMYRKGNFALSEKIGLSITDKIENKMVVEFQNIEGKFKSVNIGPAASWDLVKYSFENIESSDTISCNVIGVDKDLKEKIILQNIKLNNIDINSIDANEFPYINIEFNIKDAVNRTVPKLDYIRVFYKGIPDIALDPKSYFIFNKDSLEQGEQFNIGFGIKNLGTTKTDSIDIKYSIINIADNKELVYSKVYRSVDGLDTLHASFDKNTLDLLGEYLLIVEANPTKRFKEKYYLNNIGKKSFKVKGDINNPLLDVYFDGIHIMDGDIVSTKPEIKITLLDDNVYLPITDPESI
ncbi:MAG: hypothetical protein IPO92_17595 [Saprospiraceae bacterium]|nr:hypothetical protein [Saprospiraceae bacterium]